MAATDSTRSQSTSEKISDEESGPIPNSSIFHELDSSNEIQDPNIVWWKGPDDPENPMNWSNKKKYVHIAFISTLSLITPVASTMLAPGIPLVMKEFHCTNSQLASFIVSVYCLGFAFGPMLLAPLSELYGRRPVYWVTNVFFLLFLVACSASRNVGMLITFQFCCGFAGSAPLANGGGTIADLMPQEKRGKAMAFFGIGPILGPVVGPIIGGFLAQGAGWRWVFWLIIIISTISTFFQFIFMKETYAKAVLQTKTLKLRKSTGNEALRSKLDTGETPDDLFKASIVRPVKLLIFSPIVLTLSLFQGLCFGCLYLLMTTFSMVFTDQYHWSTGIDGLSFLGIGLGLVLSLVVFGALSDKILKNKSSGSKVGGKMKPEYRLFPMIPATLFVSLGLFWYGWTAYKKTHWIVPILGTVFIGFGYLPIVLCIQTYLVDAFEVYAASAIAASTIIRNALGALVPLAGRAMYDALGLGWGNSLLALITLLMLPAPWLFYKFGEHLRRRFKVKL